MGVAKNHNNWAAGLDGDKEPNSVCQHFGSFLLIISVSPKQDRGKLEHASLIFLLVGVWECIYILIQFF